METLIAVFCNVEILCDEKEPSWLGLIVLGVGVVIGALLFLNFVANFFSSKR
jgi:hypothetical protein